ncbi:hypothetical protein DL93DRAFT_2171317 [Clavulina sp. PMI_390]|nr:hypothetical protein DL93DRAFT_2171317 [Clavulina sp. PMI_390]
MYSQTSYPSSSYGQYSGYASSSGAGSSSASSSQQQQQRYANAYSAQPPPAPYRPAPPSYEESQNFRNWFHKELGALVENNRAVIHRLAYIAREHAERFAPVIAECMEHHIRHVHPALKLPAWYLLDSVSKNLGALYAHLFSAFVAPLFLDCYDRVDDSTRSKMEEMLVTWRTGGPGGTELFGKNAQLTVENAIWGDHSSSSSSGPTRNQVLMELDVNLAQKTRSLEQNPRDTETRSHIDVLHQLRALVQNTQMSKVELSAIVTRLRDLARTTASVAPPLPAIPPPPPAPVVPTPVPAVAPPAPSYPVSSTPMQFPNISNDTLSSALSILSKTMPSGPAAAPAPVIPSLVQQVPSASSTPAPSAVPDVSQLLKNLMAAGIINGGGFANLPKPQATNDSANVEPVSDPSSSKNLQDVKLAALKEYEAKILAMPVSLSASGLQKPQPSVVSMIYEGMSLKCKQCAWRFPENEAGQKAFEDHFDMHFRQNKRAKEAVGRGYTRSWFVGAEDWMNDVAPTNTSDAKGKGRASDNLHSYPPTSVKGIAAAAAERDANLRKQYVVVPPGDESKPITCPICKELMKTEFMEEDEEWVWRNAIVAKGKVRSPSASASPRSPSTPPSPLPASSPVKVGADIRSLPSVMVTKVYHATCHADALSSQAAARLREQSSGSGLVSKAPSRSPRSPKSPRSRSGTPELYPPPSLPVSPMRKNHIPASPLRQALTLLPDNETVSATSSLASIPSTPTTAVAGMKRKSPEAEDDLSSGLAASIAALISGSGESNKRARMSPPPSMTTHAAGVAHSPQSPTRATIAS